MTNAATDQHLLYFNGISGATGKYSIPPMSDAQLSQFIRGEAEPENLTELRYKHQQKGVKHFGVKAGVDPEMLKSAGWGIIFAHDADPEIKEALSPLLKLREKQAGKYFKVCDGQNGVRPNESKTKYLGRHKVGPGPADPDKLPYYLLIVGSPQEIPYRFQTQLDVQYAVGRIHFNTLDEYENYANSVVAVETGQVQLPRQARFFGVVNEGDEATRLSSEHLVTPLYDKLKSDCPDWDIQAILGDEAKRDRLTQLLGGDQTPALLFTASHGVDFPLNDNRQLAYQGALLCQDCPGIGVGPMKRDYYFAGEDIDSQASLLGLIAFHFACFGAGTPDRDEFAKQAFSNSPDKIAPYPFLAGLPTRMLGHPRGGALATIGHVDRAWGYSFISDQAGAHTVAFESTLKHLLDGKPVGYALEYFNERYSELSTVLSDELQEIDFGKTEDPYALAGMWTANNDARGYIIIGDPAVRLPVAKPDKKTSERPVLALKPVEALSPGQASGQGMAVSSYSTGEGGVQVGAAGVDFGARDMVSGAANSIVAVSQSLAQKLGEAVKDLSTLDVKTYTSSDDFDKPSTSRRIRAKTQISIDGDVEVIVPQRKRQPQEGEAPQDGVEIDMELWGVHKDMVALAQANRVEFLKALGEITGTIIKSLK